MILAGMDEVGYGPLLGPLVVASAAVELPGDPTADAPDLWAAWRRSVSRGRSKSGRTLHFNDSKAVYSPSAGLGELERSVLSLLTAAGGACDDLDAVLDRVAPGAAAELARQPWYRPFDGEAFPATHSADAIRVRANGLRAEVDRAGTAVVRLRASVVPEPRLNRLFDATRNKSAALFSVSAVHLDELLRDFGDRGLVAWCDRQGGRSRYGPLLRQMWPEWSLTIESEADGFGDYRLSRGGQRVRVVFAEKAEAACLATAASSMLGKYLREMLMRRFNAWWAARVPGVRPTAGYWADGLRFLADVDARRRELGIADDVLVRSR